MTNLASDVATLPSMVARLNIERFSKMLSGEADQTMRRTLMHLIAEENSKLRALVGALSSLTGTRSNGHANARVQILCVRVSPRQRSFSQL
jgi:hypothetical protein